MLDKDLILNDDAYELLPISRYKTHVVEVGKVKIGGNNPVVVQSIL